MKTTYLSLALLACLLFPVHASAQGRNFSKLISPALSKVPPSWRAKIPPSWSKALSPLYKTPKPFPTRGLSSKEALMLSREIVKQSHVEKSFLQKPALVSMEQHVRHFIFTVTPLNSKNALRASGFVFAEEYQGKIILWGLTSSSATRGMGKNVKVTFSAYGKTYSYPAQIISFGTTEGIDAALIKLPAQVAEVARPVIPAKAAPKEREKLFVYGFSNGKYQKTRRKTIESNADRIVASHPEGNTADFHGSLVLNAKGEAVGINAGGYSPAKNNLYWYSAREGMKELPKADLSEISEIVPFNRAYDLIREYRAPGSAHRVILFAGMMVGKLAPNEFVERVTVHYENGSYIVLPRNPFFDVTDLQRLFPYEDAVKAEIVINKNGNKNYSYIVNVKERKSTKTGERSK